MQPLDHGVFWHGVNLLTAWDLVHALKVHAPCCEFILAILAEVRVITVMDWKPRLAILHVRQKLAECQARKNFQTSMEAHTDILAVFHIHPAFSDSLPPHNFAQALWDENSAWICLGNPRETFPVGVSFERTPHIEEDGQVDKVLSVWPSDSFWICHLDKASCIRVQFHLDVTEHHPALTSEHVCFQLLRLLEKLDVHALFFTACLIDCH